MGLLIVARGWWILEFLPIRYMKLKADLETWEEKIGINKGMFRGVVEPEPKMHWTVASRVKNLEYKLGARSARSATWHQVA